MSIEHQIQAALAARVAQRDLIDSLARSWEQLIASWDRITTSVEGLAVAAAGSTALESTKAGVFMDIAAYLTAGAGWRERAAWVLGSLDEATNLVRALHRRVYRETVNIGMIGQTHAGKSTLVRKLTGLDERQIPSNRLSPATASPFRIFHEPGPGRAVMTMHSWETFRAEVLAPMHELASVFGPAPLSVEEFRRFPGYRADGHQVEVGHVEAERYRRRLLTRINS